MLMNSQMQLQIRNQIKQRNISKDEVNIDNNTDNYLIIVIIIYKKNKRT